MPAKHSDELVVETFYGINRTTSQVESVRLRADGMLQKFNDDRLPLVHPVKAGRSPQTEIIMTWHLTDLISFKGGANEERRKKAIEDLEARARKMKEDQENILGG